jgi:hypothetical protein
MKLHEEFKLYENMWESVSTKDWYGADAEVEFETSVYPDIAKYFGLKSDEVVTYAYYYTDEVIVNYDDAAGRSHEIEKHVPLDQVEEWFKAGYTILDEAKKPLTEARSVTEIEAEIAKLERRLAAAKAELIATKKANLDGKRPEYLYTWDMYINEADKGSWIGAEYFEPLDSWDGSIFETEAEAIAAGKEFLKEPLNIDLLDGPIEAYTIDTVAIPIEEVSNDQLEYYGLNHLI